MLVVGGSRRGVVAPEGRPPSVPGPVPPVPPPPVAVPVPPPSEPALETVGGAALCARADSPTIATTKRNARPPRIPATTPAPERRRATGRAGKADCWFGGRLYAAR